MGGEPPTPTQFDRFAIGFDRRDRARLHRLWDEVIDSEQWSEGEMTRRFEAAWAQWNGLEAVATASWSGAMLAALAFAEVEGRAVICPSNTFMATPLAIEAAGGEVVFADCGRADLCLSFEDFERKAEAARPKAAVLVHIGGHLAFDSERIAAYCRDHGIFLIEDCAHAHGASWNGRRAGSFGDAGAWSFYATKTVSTGEGGMLVSRHDDLLAFARDFRNYGKPEHVNRGLNFRMSEFTAALGLVQTERLEEIVAFKREVARTVLDPANPGRLVFPRGMESGYYKYVTFDELDRSTGRVYEQPCHRIMGHQVTLPNSDWVGASHWCAPLYYRPPAAVEPAGGAAR